MTSPPHPDTVFTHIAGNCSLSTKNMSLTVESIWKILLNLNSQISSKLETFQTISPYRGTMGRWRFARPVRRSLVYFSQRSISFVSGSFEFSFDTGAKALLQIVNVANKMCEKNSRRRLRQLWLGDHSMNVNELFYFSTFLDERVNVQLSSLTFECLW